MTYTLTATKQQNGQATVRGKFSYEENILFPHYEPGKDKEWTKAGKDLTKRRQTRQVDIRECIKQFLESKYGAKGLKNYEHMGLDGFVLTDHYIKQKRNYHATSNGETTYDVEVNGTLKQGEHLEDMLDCDALDAKLKQFFDGDKK